MKTKETYEFEELDKIIAKSKARKASLVGKLCKFRKIIVLVVKEEKNSYRFFGKRYYALFPDQGIDILPESSLKVI